MSAVSSESQLAAADLSDPSAHPSSQAQAGADFGANEWLVDELYQRYLADPGSVDKAWWSFFADYRPVMAPGNGSAPSANAADAPAGPAPVPAPAPARGTRPAGREGRPGGPAVAWPPVPRPAVSRPPVSRIAVS